MLEDLLVAEASLSHNGSTDLAKAYAVSPTTSVKDKPLWNTTSDVLRLDGKGTALQVRRAEQSANLKFLADDESLVFAHDTQLADVSAWSLLHYF